MDNVTFSLVIGHKEEKPGACNDKHGICEFEFNKYLVLAVSKELDYIPHRVHFRRSYSELPSQINALDPGFIISFHCNAYNGSASGTEVLYYETSRKGKVIADILNRELVKALELRDRGIKPKSEEDRGGYLLKNTIAPCVICEPFFIDNDSDLERAQERRDDLVNAYVGGIHKIIANKDLII